MALALGPQCLSTISAAQDDSEIKTPEPHGFGHPHECCGYLMLLKLNASINNPMNPKNPINAYI